LLPFAFAEREKLLKARIEASPEDSLVHDRDGWRFIAVAMLIINAIWLVFGVLGYGLAGIIFR
jgi:hypothetical protein